MSAQILLMFGALAIIVVSVTSLQCFHCGLYNDGVGSITPCINETYMTLKPCPHRESNFCIKYTSEGTIVRDCVEKCVEKEDWGSKTYCCMEDACNSSHHPLFSSALVVFPVMVAVTGLH
ncbi:uncharacterized protein LOC132704049 [Cylas formicarius]|uniref:uncharacterized protein LOC132704049 n=1 Tax=Cylas formicarius TaxID=197179 RepID=UPI0029588EC7|nr:uncharacterized protein LOC132704049 [Cylas formicarius]